MSPAKKRSIALKKMNCMVEDDARDRQMVPAAQMNVGATCLRENSTVIKMNGKTTIWGCFMNTSKVSVHVVQADF